MSVVHTAAQVVATTPLPSPQVVKETTREVVQVPVQVPAYVLQFFQTLALAGAAAFLSLLHALADRGKWSSTVNRLVVTTYTLLAALGTWFLSHHAGVTTNELQSLLSDFLVALGAALGSYNLVLKSILQAFGWTAPAGAEAQTLATDADPAQGMG